MQLQFVWYVIETKCMQEALAVRMLRNWCAGEGIKVWRPLQRIGIGRGRRKRTIVRSRMPGYLLMRLPIGRLTNEVWQRVKRTRGVHGWLCARVGDSPLAISDSTIKAMRHAIITKARKTKQLKSQGFAKGEIVSVVNKLILDLYGSAIARIVSVDNRSRARILIASTGAVVPLTIKTTDLRKLSAQAA